MPRKAKKESNEELQEEKKKKKSTSKMEKKKEHISAEKKEPEVVEDTTEEKDSKKKRIREKNTFNLTEVIVVMVVTAMLSLMIGCVITYVVRDQKVCFSSTCSTHKELKDFISLYDDIVDEYYTTVDKEGLVNAAISGMVNALGDNYSSYLDGTAADDFNHELQGGFTGMGVEITYTGDDNKILVLKVYENSPAEQAGLKANDILLKINNTDVTGMELNNVAKIVQDGENGTKFTLEVLRGENNVTLEVTRGYVELTSVTGEVMELNGKKVGYITITTFAQNSYEQFEKVYQDLEKAGVESLLLDLRDNSGGYLTTAKDIASLFLDKDDVVYQLASKDKTEKVTSGTEKKITMPVAVLVNVSSASASEVLTAALHENLNAPVVGTKTFGKGTVQKVKELSNGAVVKYTIQNWLTPSGNAIEGVGITPTDVVNVDNKYFENPTYENDAQLQAALGILTK